MNRDAAGADRSGSEWAVPSTEDGAGRPVSGRCQLQTDEGRCPYEAAWRGVLRVAHDRFEVDTCDRHRAGILDAYPIDGNWEWRRAPEVEFARRQPVSESDDA